MGKEKFYYTEKEIDFTVHLDYNQFYLQEFFNLDDNMLNRFFEEYLSSYGQVSLTYLKKKYNSWKKRHYHLTRHMQDKIIRLMPLFITNEAKHKLGVYEFTNLIRINIEYWSWSKVDTFIWNWNLKIEDVIKRFEDDYDRICKFTLRYKYDGVFKILLNDEVKEVEAICKYILKTKLIVEFNKLKDDFEVFFSYVDKIKEYDIEDVEYNLSFYSGKLNLTNKDCCLNKFSTVNFNIPYTENNSKYKNIADKYLAYELVNVRNENNKKIVKSILNKNNLDLFLSHYNNLANTKSVSHLKGSFNGEGGVLFLNLKIIPPYILKWLIVKSITTIILLVFFSGLILYALWGTIFIIYILFIIASSLMLFGNLEIEKIKQNIKNLKINKNYGK
ncbi:MAG: hypothetical protein KGV44_05945 [Flavobacteriaceae bacterium]|nr:hypothetical protein [Flavobacteriaceae bacterium]